MTGAAVRERPGVRRPRAARVAVGTAIVLVGLALAVAELCVGEPMLTPARALGLLVHPDGSQTALIVHTLRLPRLVLAVAVGAALAISGVVMQALTRNPLAEPGILGVNAGASLAVTFAFVVLGLRGFGVTLAVAAVGAAVAGLLVALLGGVGRSASAARLVLAGVAFTAVVSGLTQAVSLVDPGQYARIRVWEAGSLAARDTPTALLVTGVIAAGVILALSIGPGLNLLMLGDDTAQALGGRVTRVRVAGLVAVVVLCGTATAAIGPVAFVGLLVPHAVRAFTGADQVRALWASLAAGPVLLLVADLLARTVAAPAEVPLGVVTAFLGAPVLIALVHRYRRPV
ncbi:MULTISPECIES: iron ABC transporter permease [Microbacterium]|uniref:FecCD family ABC transporter permease n=1 Tax=Microbacterium TaxID=33882 RepID=UPI0023DCB106|nr:MULTISPECIES: iron ABC transporter permease [Microbacterium]MDF2046273.1 iron ABC transporter permease [Microbacterium sp. Kw_RZR3]MDQ1116807.1 iron complex transport system permease protein [Microbacterium testaceum]